jgi:hypothetical protein
VTGREAFDADVWKLQPIDVYVFISILDKITIVNACRVLDQILQWGTIVYSHSNDEVLLCLWRSQEGPRLVKCKAVWLVMC